MNEAAYNIKPIYKALFLFSLVTAQLLATIIAPHVMVCGYEGSCSTYYSSRTLCLILFVIIDFFFINNILSKPFNGYFKIVDSFILFVAPPTLLISSIFLAFVYSEYTLGSINLAYIIICIAFSMFSIYLYKMRNLFPVKITTVIAYFLLMTFVVVLVVHPVISVSHKLGIIPAGSWIAP